MVLRPAEPYRLPGGPTKDGRGDTDCNNAVHWDGDTMYVFASFGHPFRSAGPDLFRLSRPSERTDFDNAGTWQGGCRWIEATYKAADGRLYGWHHNEPHPVCNKDHWTAPRIGAVVSTDNGLTWKDLGIVLTAPPDSLNCDSKNFYFVGGNGDFCVNLDRDQRFFYFFISAYHKDVAEQGVAVARMACADRDAPIGKVAKWHKEQWSEPGLGGHVTPIYPVRADWHRADADASWGPSVHWNTHLGQWVMLLNRAKDKDWNQKGVYVAFNTDIGRPAGRSLSGFSKAT